MDVVAHRLEGRHVNSICTVGELSFRRAPDQTVQAMEEGGQGFTRAGGRRDEDVPAGADHGPAANLRLRGFGEPRLEPLGNQRVEIRQGHAGILARFALAARAK